MRIDETLKSLSPLAYMVGLNSFDLVEAHNPVEALRVCAKAEPGSVAVSVQQTVRNGTVFSELEARMAHGGLTPVEIEADASKARRWLIHAVDAGNKVQTMLALASSHDQIEVWAEGEGWDLLSAQSEATLQRLLDLASAAKARSRA